MSEILTTAEMRQAAHEEPAKMQPIATPFWPKLDGHVAIGDVPMPELQGFQSLQQPGNTGPYCAAVICRVLVNKDTGERIFPDEDRDWMVGRTSIIMSLMPIINDFFGLS